MKKNKTKTKNAEWKDEALDKSISQPCRVKTGLLWPPPPAAVNRACSASGLCGHTANKGPARALFNASSFHSENRRDKVMVIGFCGDSISEQESLQGENQ